MAKINENYGKTEIGTNCRIDWDAVTFFLLTDQPPGDLEVENAWFYTPVGSPKNKYRCGLHTNWWFTNYQRYGLRNLWRST